MGQYHKIKGTSAFFGGILVVLFGYPLIGMIIEAYGFIVLFSGFFPVAVNFLRRIPIIGSILNLPGISSVILSYFFTFFCPLKIHLKIFSVGSILHIWSGC